MKVVGAWSQAELRVDEKRMLGGEVVEEGSLPRHRRSMDAAPLDTKLEMFQIVPLQLSIRRINRTIQSRFVLHSRCMIAISPHLYCTGSCIYLYLLVMAVIDERYHDGRWMHRVIAQIELNRK